MKKKMNGVVKPIQKPAEKEVVGIDFMSHDGDFKLTVEGSDMKNCKNAFMELFKEVKKSVKKKHDTPNKPGQMYR